MFHYLARRDYKLFHVVREHIEALHSGRRQLLAQTLNEEETVNMRRECVIRLVSGNIVQGLDVIVRHPTWGGLVNVDIENVSDPRSWISAVRMYSMQTSLAYLNFQEEVEIKPYRASTDQLLTGAVSSPSYSAFPELPSCRRQSQVGTTKPTLRQSSAKFYHIFLDLRAFVASPCAPGETAELFFSLYKKQGTQFVTEDFCAVLNHNGVLARDPTGKVRTLFTDLAYADIQDPVYLVCRIVRNGSFKLSLSTVNGTSENGKRAGETTSRSDSTWDLKNSTSTNGTRTIPSTEAGGQVRRPFGCAVLELTQLSKMTTDQNDSTTIKECTMPIYVPTSEASFSMIHQSIINNIAKEYEKSPRYVSPDLT
jgi:dedicator of cytokinesis protein 3